MATKDFSSTKSSTNTDNTVGSHNVKTPADKLNLATTLNYPSKITPIYAIAPGATKADVGEFLAIRLAHLKALLAMTNGGAGEEFRCYNDTIQDEFLESCELLAKECSELFNHMCTVTA